MTDTRHPEQTVDPAVQQAVEQEQQLLRERMTSEQITYLLNRCVALNIENSRLRTQIAQMIEIASETEAEPEPESGPEVEPEPGPEPEPESEPEVETNDPPDDEPASS